MPGIVDSIGANSKIYGYGGKAISTPGRKIVSNGQSVEYAKTQTSNWFPIRATFHRAQQVFDSISKIDFGNKVFEPYLPLLRKIVYTNDDFKNPTQYIKDIPLDPSLLFVRTGLSEFKEMLSRNIPGLTPYYNHFFINEFGKNEFLTVPDNQMKSFRIIVESGNENIMIDQDTNPKFINGDQVIVIGGPFEGVEGKVLKFKGQRRVFVELQDLGCFGTAYIPKHWIRKVE